MLSKNQITSASATLDEVDVTMMVTLIRASIRFKENPAYYNDVEARIEDVDGTVKAKQLNAVLAEIVNLGIGEVGISGGDEGVRYSQTSEREALVNYAISVIYSQPFDSVSVVDEDGGSNSGGTGNYRVAQRELDCYKGYL